MTNKGFGQESRCDHAGLTKSETLPVIRHTVDATVPQQVIGLATVQKILGHDRQPVATHLLNLQARSSQPRY
jgi:hypothetical protein